MLTGLLYPAFPAPMLPRPSAGAPRAVQAPSVEMLPVVDENGVVTAQASRAWCHGARLLHPTVHLHLMDRYGRLFLQKRSLQKDLLPGFWDTAVGGHVSYGEDIAEALYREAEEELGLTAFNPVFLTRYLYENDAERELVHVFAAVGTFELQPHNDEVDAGKWWEMQEIDLYLGKSVITPNFEGEFVRIRPSLEALL